MRFTPAQYAEALFQALSETKPSDHAMVVDNFAQVLKERGDLGKMDEIEKHFYTLEKKSRGISSATVTSAHTLSKKQEKEIIKRLNKEVKGKVELEKKIDEELIGGVVVRLEDKQINGSIKKFLSDLKNKLIT